MLEKNLKSLPVCDSHFHLVECLKFFDFCSDLSEFKNWHGMTCLHSKKEWKIFNELQKENKIPKNLFVSFGLHPQNPDFNDFDFLENLAKEKKINGIGETGFDYFTNELKQNSKNQEEAFLFQLEIALKYNLPLTIHCRKANHKLFEHSNKLKKINGVLFHSFMGTSTEAFSLLRRGINSYFSFGKQILNNNKKVYECVKNIPLNFLLLETDAPFQTLKSEKFTFLSDINSVYKKVFAIKNEGSKNISEIEFSEILLRNFYDVFKK